MDRPILFSTPMVQAILNNIKKMTRRVINLRFLPGYNPEWTGYKPVFEYGEFFLANSKGEPATKPVKCPYGKPGDTLWVRETWCRGKARNGDNKIIYKADIETDLQPIHTWKPSIFMPRGAARIFLKVKNVRVERLWEISEEDAKTEGLYKGYQTSSKSSPATSAKQAFMWIWQKINGDESWLSNPWVWVVEFEVKELKL